jgi:nucleoside-diphosphate-sugar epimerase
MNQTNKSKVMLIGGCGFIGHHLALALKIEGHEVVVCDSLMVNNLFSYQAKTQGEFRYLYTQFLNERLNLLREADVKLYVVDARNYADLEHVVTAEQPDTIVHFAAVSHADRSNKDPHTTFDHSMITLENSLELARRHVGHFVFFSSSMVYGTFESDSVSEESVCNPLGIYGALKYGGEKLVIAYSQVFDLPYTIIRPSALYGPRCVSGRVGQKFIENAIAGKPIRVKGEGEERLDFTYIDDMVQGITRVIQSPKSRNETFNITYGSSQSLADMVAVLKEELSGVVVEYQERDRLMPVRGTLSVEKAKRLLGYEPAYSLKNGFRSYIRWYLDWIAINGKENFSR